MSAPLDCPALPSAVVAGLTPPELVDLVGKQEREIAQLRQQVAWFQRQLFGQKSEKRLPNPEGVQGVLGEGFLAAPTTPVSGKRKVAGLRTGNG